MRHLGGLRTWHGPDQPPHLTQEGARGPVDTGGPGSVMLEGITNPASVHRLWSGPGCPQASLKDRVPGWAAPRPSDLPPLALQAPLLSCQ